MGGRRRGRICEPSLGMSSKDLVWPLNMARPMGQRLLEYHLESGDSNDDWNKSQHGLRDSAIMLDKGSVQTK